MNVGLEVISRFRRNNPTNSNLKSSESREPIFEADDIAIMEFLEPQAGRSGTSLIQPFRMYHDHNAGNFMGEILDLLDQGKTVILDLGNANEEVMQYFSRGLSEAVFRHQTTKFTNNQLGNHFIQLYFEEAHNLFKDNDNSEETRIYRRFAKEGAKYHIGMVYATQSPTTINSDLLAQTENFFIAHLASTDDVSRLAKVNVAYESLKDDILNAKTPGYIRMLTRSHRFVISMQALKFTPPKAGE
ncbi:MAG: ATP-binding protein [Nitrospirae bacterium]|nr:ATP-binding protein [Nitrospirota bacterium]